MAMEMRGSLNLSAYYMRPEQPKYYGRALINGVEYNLKGWEKEGPKGVWISLLFEDPTTVEKKRSAEFSRTDEQVPLDAYRDSLNRIDDDIPF